MFSPSLRRFLAYLKPYRGLVTLAVVTRVARYLIPLALPWAMKVVVDDILVPGAPHRLSLNLLMGGMTALYVAHGFVSYWRSNFAGTAGHRLVFDLRRDLYQHIQRMSLSFFERQRIGAIVIVLAVWHWKLALVSLVVLPFYAFLSKGLNRRI
ncbi:MAG: ABC transporter ATP-binding protein [Gemmatimonadetes bacterium]|nr:ABC transporter ATP-binding protein [Gemmatimonadota bacterium]